MRKILTTVILLAALAGLAFGGWKLYDSFRAAAWEIEAGEALEPSVVTEPPDQGDAAGGSDGSGGGTGGESGGGARPKERMPFDRLRSVNQDIVGWLKVDGTEINYPVAQAADNEYYLYWDVNRRRSIFGALFLDYRDRPDFSDFSNVIYGHHIVNSSKMFQTLTRFKEQSFFETNRGGTLYTPETTYDLELFAVLLTSPYDDVFEYAFPTPAAQQAHLDHIREKAMYYREIGVTTADRLLVLSTCSYEYTEARTIVVARLADQGMP
ncbi:MAG: class B sortase [Oscillospiraceae bacterium]|jgi:sortase B|nr:class B sortase [Oscillospiraceae bacterium]